MVTSLAKSNENDALSVYALPPMTPSAGGLGGASLLQVLWRRKLMVAGSCLAALLAVSVYVMGATRIYTSSAHLLIQQASSSTPGESAGSGGGWWNYLFAQCEIIQSRPILARAVTLLGGKVAPTLPTDSKPSAAPAKQPPLPQAVVRGGDWGEILAKGGDPVEVLKGALKVEVGRLDGMVKVSVDWPEPHGAAAMVNAVVAAYVSDQSSQKRSATEAVLTVLEKEKARREAELEQRTQALTTFRKQNIAVAMDSGRGNVILQRLGSLSDIMTSAELEVMEAKAAYDSAVAASQRPGELRELMDMRPNPAIGVLPRASDPLYMDQTQLELRLAGARRQYGEDHVTVRNLREDLKLLQQKIALRDKNLSLTYMTALKDQWGLARQKLEDLSKRMDAQRKLVTDLNGQLADYAKLQSEVERSTKMVETLDARIKEINLAEQSGALNIRVVEPARVERSPSRPRTPKLVAAFLAVGLLLGCGMALVTEHIDQRFHTTEDMSGSLGTPVIGSVPHISRRKNHRAELITYLDPQSQAAESYRAIRAAVFYAGRETPLRSILVTSPTPGDGKTTSAVNLAIAMAHAGRRTLLLDADFRKSATRSVFGFTDKKGLLAVMEGRLAWQEAVHPTQIRNLDVLPCGTTPLDPSELVAGEAFGSLLDELSTQYDCVIVDSPPVLRVADARVLGGLCDATLMVLRRGYSDRRDGQRAIEAITAMGANVLGLIANDVARSDGYGMGYGYPATQDASSYVVRSVSPRHADAPALNSADRAEMNGNG